MNRPGQSLLSRLNFARPQSRGQVRKSRLGTETLLSLLSQLSSGHLKMTLPDGNIREFGNKADKLHAEIEILDWSVFKQVLSHGDIGFAESYIRGESHNSRKSHLWQLVWLHSLPHKTLVAR